MRGNLFGEIAIYCHNRVERIEKEVASVNDMIAHGECVPLLEYIDRHGGPYANTYRLNLGYLVEIEAELGHFLPQDTYDYGACETIENNLWKEMSKLLTLSEHLREDAFVRNRPDPENQHARKLIAQAHTIEDEGERRRRIAELAGRYDSRVRESIGPAGPYIIDALSHSDHDYESLAEAVGMCVKTIRRVIKRMGPALEEIGLEPIVMVSKEGRKHILSLSGNWRSNLASARKQMTTDGTMMNRTIRHANELLLRLSLLRGQITDPDVLADVDRIEVDCNKLLDAIEPGRAVVVSNELAQVENSLRDLQPIGDAEVWDYLLRVEYQGGEEGEAAPSVVRPCAKGRPNQ